MQPLTTVPAEACMLLLCLHESHLHPESRVAAWLVVYVAHAVASRAVCAGHIFRLRPAHTKWL